LRSRNVRICSSTATSDAVRSRARSVAEAVRWYRLTA
jgi:hypothetical protein